MKYTVRQATATGKVDAKYGSEYIVNFNEDQRDVKLSRQKPVEVGQEENGSIVDGQYGAYFKKDPFVPNAQGVPTNVAEKKWAPVRKDNSDGMKQGMATNNAANYVNTISPELTAKEWAELVHEYASALYVLGDLGPKEATDAENIAATFGV